MHGESDPMGGAWRRTFDGLARLTGGLSARAAAACATVVVTVIAIVGVGALVAAGDAASLALRGYPVVNDGFSHLIVAAIVAPAIAWPVFRYGVAVTRSLHRARAELKVAAEEAERASRMKSTFLAVTSHEIRTPLNGVIGMAELLRRSAATPGQKEHVAILTDAAETLARLLTDILDISKAEAGRMTVAPEPTDLHALLEGAVALWAPRAAEKRIGLRLRLDPTTPRWALLDGARVRQCVGNLVSNAIKFTETGEVAVSVRAIPDGDGRRVSVEVRDTGPGLSAEEQAQLFQPFGQVGAAERRRAGAGLGLAISRTLARLMGGDIALESEPGRGSAFTLSFRAGPAAAASRAAPVEAPPPLRILVADDTPTNLLVARLLLAAEGHTVTTAEGGREALAALEAAPFDVALLDMHMPDPDGPETLRRIRASGRPWARTPVIALTADAMSEDRARYTAMGMDGYATKPIDIRALQAEIARVSGMRRAA